MREIRLSGSTSGDWKREPIKGLPRQSSTLLSPWNRLYRTENPRVGGSIPPLATSQIKVLGKNDTDINCLIMSNKPPIILLRGALGRHSNQRLDLMKNE
jgi:hypothetical protein